MRHSFGLVGCLMLCLASCPVLAETYHQEELRIPMEGAPTGLEALLLRLDGSERRPLALINHGSPRKAADRATYTVFSYWQQAVELARRGWVAAVVLRRGYGTSGGAYAESGGGCANADPYRAGLASTKDLRAAFAFLSKRPDVDAARMISIGVSAGGFATVALTADPPPGLVAAISFAGGRGSPADGQICREDRLVDAFAKFGQASRVPMLWVYAENDHYFGPQSAKRFVEAFSKAGGKVSFLAQPPFGEDGHRLFSITGIPRWTPLVDSFLVERGLKLRATPASLPHPNLKPPTSLNASGRAAFEQYIEAAPHKAFATSPNGGFSWRSGRPSAEKAKADTLESCAQSHRTGCQLRFLDDRAE